MAMISMQCASSINESVMCQYIQLMCNIGNNESNGRQPVILQYININDESNNINEES